MTGERLRVLLVAHATGAWQLELWRRLASDVDLHIAVGDDAPNVEAFPHSREPLEFGTTHALAVRGRLRRGYTWWTYRGLGALTRRLAPDLVHVASEPWGFLAQQASLSHRPVVIHGAETVWDQGSRAEALIRRQLTGRTLKKAAGFVSWNTDGLRLAAAHGLPDTTPRMLCPFNISPAPPYVRERDRVWSRREDGAARPLVVGYAGRVTRFKGLDWLVDAMSVAARRGLDARLEVAGAGTQEYCAELSQRARDAGVDLAYLGALATESLPSVMGGWDLAVVPSLTTPSWKEQFGRTALEAMMTGLPVIVSRSGALPEVVAGAGRVVDEGDIDGLAGALLDLSDPDDRLRAGRAAARHADETYGSDVLAARMRAFWEQVLAPGRARTSVDA